MLLAALLFAAATTAPRDARVEWLATHATPIRSIDPADDDYTDLEALRKTLAGARVVLLGEQNHSDGPTFLAKTRLIRFLHERMGFDVLAFESGVYDCEKAWEHLKAGEPAREAVPRGVFPIWTKSREVQPLIDYLGREAKGAHPLELAGVDCQLTGTAPEEFLIADLHAQGFADARVESILKGLMTSRWENDREPRPPVAEQQAFHKTIDAWRAAAKTPFWRQVLTDIGVFADVEWTTNLKDDAKSAAIRDRRMGENLVWLARERYPNRKIIVWAATFHNARNVRQVDAAEAKTRNFYAIDTPMGEVAKNALGDQLYSLGFTSYEGEFARLWEKTAHPLPPVSRDSFEDLCARAGLTNAVIDFHHAPRWLRTRMLAQILGHTEHRADWTRVVDGVVFLKRMDRSHNGAQASRLQP